MNAEDSELIDKFIAYRIEYDRISPNTVVMYTTWLSRFASFIEESGYDMLTVTPDVLLSYKKSLESKRNATIRAYWASLNAFYSWACGPAIQLLQENPVPKIKLEAAAKFSSLIPSARDIFSMRASQKINNPTKAAVFELMLSSGMRIAEVGQIRCCDLVIATEIIDDVELGRKSPFVGGSLKLSVEHGFIVKRGKSRKVYFSRLAAKMLQCHVATHGLSLDSNLPLFPYDASTLCRWFKAIGEDVVNRSKPVEYRDPSLNDITSACINSSISKKYLKALNAAKARKSALEEEFPGYKDAARKEPERKFSFHPHCLRHFYACLMYYRSWNGTHTDLHVLTQLLGHSGIKESVDYMKLEPVCKNMNEWKQIMLGNGMEYRTILY